MRRDPSMRRKRSLASPRGRTEDGIQRKPSRAVKEEVVSSEGGPPLGMQRTLTMYKTPLSRTLSMAQPGGGTAAPKGDAGRLLLDKQEPTMDDRKELNTVEIPEKLLAAGLTVTPVQNKKKAELLTQSGKTCPHRSLYVRTLCTGIRRCLGGREQDSSCFLLPFTDGSTVRVGSS